MKLMSRNLRFMLLVLAMGGSAGVQAAEGLIGDPVAGEAKAGLCGGCHGTDGNSADATYPRLAGQYAGYIVKQVKDFQKGHRTNNDTMAGMAQTVASTQDAKDIGSYFSQQKMKGKLTKTDSKLAAAGEKIFKEGNPKTGLYGCINCHGVRGKGKAKNISVFPRIGGQHRDYIIKELTDFRAGKRSNDPAGMMQGIASKLTDKEIHALAEYLSSQL
jgi:cytochrome c553